MPAPPDHLNEVARREWDRVAPGLYALGLLTELDSGVLAGYCTAYSRWMQAELAIAELAERDPLTAGLIIRSAKGNAIQNPLIGIANKAANDMARFACEFGMTPSARSRIAAGASATPTSKWDGLIGPVKTD